MDATYARDLKVAVIQPINNATGEQYFERVAEAIRSWCAENADHQVLAVEFPKVWSGDPATLILYKEKS